MKGINKWPYIDPPQIHKNEYKYKYIKVVDINGKGKGVIATSNISPGLLIPYGGVCVATDEIIKLQKNSGNGILNYCADMQNGYHADALPAKYTSNIKYAWIGSYINEASENENYNCKLIILYPNSVPPCYPEISTSIRIMVEVKTLITKGQELLAPYFYHTRCYHRLGYKRKVFNPLIIPGWEITADDEQHIQKAEQQTPKEHDYVALREIRRNNMIKVNAAKKQKKELLSSNK